MLRNLYEGYDNGKINMKDFKSSLQRVRWYNHKFLIIKNKKRFDLIFEIFKIIEFLGI